MYIDPVTEKNFYDREEYLNLLLKRAKGIEEGYRQNIAILGEETIGKTSLLLQFISKIHENNQHILPIYFEISLELPFEHLVNRFIAVTLYNLLKLFQQNNPPQNIEELTKRSERLAPKTLQEVKNCLEQIKINKFTEAYSTMLTIPHSISQELNIPIILIIEEFHRLEKLPFIAPFNELAKKIMISKNVMYILSSSSIVQAKKILSKELALLFGNFEVIILEPFDIKISNNYLEEKINPVKCSIYYKDFISEITDGRPFYLNLISSEIKSISFERKAKFVTDDIIIEALTNLLFDSSGILNQFFTLRIKELPTNRSPLSYSSILLSIAHDCNKARKIKNYLYTNSEKEFLNHLNIMIETGYVSRNGVFYYLNDQLFKLWLIEVYEKKRNSLDIKLETKRRNFKDSLQQRLNTFLKNRKKSIVERFQELLEAFENETVYFGHKRVKLPNFENIETKSMSPHLPLVIGKTQNKSWIFVIKNNHVDRTSMEEIYSYCNRLKVRKTHKFIVALNGIDEDARLLAKEAKFITLESQDLNSILKLYGKFKIYC